MKIIPSWIAREPDPCEDIKIIITLKGSAADKMRSLQAEKDFDLADCALDALAIWHKIVDEIKKGGRPCILKKDGTINFNISTKTTCLWEEENDKP